MNVFLQEAKSADLEGSQLVNWDESNRFPNDGHLGRPSAPAQSPTHHCHVPRTPWNRQQPNQL